MWHKKAYLFSGWESGKLQKLKCEMKSHEALEESGKLIDVKSERNNTIILPRGIK